jgi:hypothetical protein
MKQTYLVMRGSPASTCDLLLEPLAAPTVEESIVSGLAVRVDDIDTRTISMLRV